MFNLNGRHRLRLLGLAGVILGMIWPLHIGAAQNGQTLWTQPVNVSRSGAASQPALAAAPDGTLHLVWWDAVDGEQYARTTTITGTQWTQPTQVAQIVGRRKLDPQTNKITLTAPRDVRLESNSNGDLYAFWLNADDELQNALNRGAGWGEATTLADSALAADVAANARGSVDLAYVRSLNTPGNPSGIYYRAITGTAQWSAPVLVAASPYFRTPKPAQVHLSIAGDGQGRVLIVWDDIESGASLYARSTNGGRAWSDPQPVGTLALASAASASATRAHLAAASSGDLFLLWQDTRAGGCALVQRRSTDGGQTWGAPERVLGGLARCPARWSSASTGDGGVWLTGRVLPDESGAAGAAGAVTPAASTVALAAWNGRGWLAPVTVSLGSFDAALKSTVNLGCLSVSLARSSAGAAGCDSKGDIWAARSAVPPDQLLPALKPAWDAPTLLGTANLGAVNPGAANPGATDLAAGAAPEGAIALAADNALSSTSAGKAYAMWSQPSAAGQAGNVLYAAAWDGTRWSRPAPALRSPTRASITAAGEQAAAKAEQPSLAVSPDGRVHAVWSGGETGEILYSWAYARDAASSRWSDPARLPAPSPVGSWPSVVADPRYLALHVVYAVPYNEARGIYYVRSDDGGTTWLTPTLVMDAARAGAQASAPASGTGVDKPRLALDARSDTLHAVWLKARMPGAVGAQAVMVARSTDGGATWSAPVQAAQGQVDWPQIVVAAPGQVHLIWTRARATSSLSQGLEAWAAYSPDGGGRFSEPARVRGLEQVSGPVSAATDEAGALYVVGMGQSASGESQLLYARWDGGKWSERDAFSLGQVATAGNAAFAALSPGGRLNVLLRESVTGADGNSQFEIVATGRQVAAGAPPAPAPTFTPLPTRTPTPTATPQPTATARPVILATGTLAPLESGSLSGQTPLALGGALAGLAIVATLGLALAWTRR